MTDVVDLWTYRANVHRVVDGDTLYLDIDLGFRNTTRQSIRLVGVMAPELFSGTAAERAIGQHAKECLLNWVLAADNAASMRDPEWPLLVRTEKDKQTFARYLGHVWSPYPLEGLPSDLNAWLQTEPWT